MMQRTFLLLLASMLLSASYAQDFTIGTVPDIQNLVAANSEHVKGEMQFYIDKQDSLNLQFVAFLGDYTAYGYDGYQSPHADWQRAQEASYMLRDAEIPYSPCIGNHDMDYVPCMDKPELALTRFIEYFPVSDYENKPGFGGYFRNMSNNYFLFSASGMDFVIVTLQTHDDNAYYDLESIDWANEIIEQYSDRRAIFVTHDFYEHRKLINDVIKQHDNLFLAICGHSCSREAYWTEESPSGNTVHCMMADYQCDNDNGATLRYLTFKPDQNQINAFTWNAVTNSYETDASSQFSFDYYMRSPETPVIFNISNDPLYPLSSDSTEINARIIDDLGIVSAKLNWGLESGNYTDTIEMSADGEYYSAYIPENTDQQTVYYCISAVDTDGNDTISEEYSYIIEDDRSKLPCPFNPTQTAYSNEPISLPGRIEAEKYNKGCDGFAYSDSEEANQGGRFRNDKVDIEACSDEGGGFNIGWTVANEFLNYKVNVTQAGNYFLSVRTASQSGGGAAHLEIDGIDITGKVKFPSTGGWQTWKTTIISDIPLSEGVQDIKLVIDEGDFNLNYFDLTLTLESSSVDKQTSTSVNSGSVYPNTGTGLFTLNLSETAENMVSVVSVMDVAGNVVHAVPYSDSRTSLTIDLSDKAKGMYFIKIGATTHKVLKL